MTAERLREFIGVAVLPAAQPLVVTPTMLQQKDLSVTSANSKPSREAQLLDLGMYRC